MSEDQQQSPNYGSAERLPLTTVEALREEVSYASGYLNHLRMAKLPYHMAQTATIEPLYTLILMADTVKKAPDLDHEIVEATHDVTSLLPLTAEEQNELAKNMREVPQELTADGVKAPSVAWYEWTSPENLALLRKWQLWLESEFDPNEEGRLSVVAEEFMDALDALSERLDHADKRVSHHNRAPRSQF
jgi:hypothetical protein